MKNVQMRNAAAAEERRNEEEAKAVAKRKVSEHFRKNDLGSLIHFLRIL